MNDLPPPDPSTLDQGPQRASRRAQFRQRPRWQRWTAYGGATFLALAGIGAAVGDDDSDPTATPTTIATENTAAETTQLVTTTGERSTPAPSQPAATTTATSPTTSTVTSTTTTTVAPATTAPSSLLALDVLAMIPVSNEQQDGYDRDRFGYAGDLDGDGCDTRAEVLIRDSLTPAQVDPSGCHVVAGDWLSSYDGLTWTDPAEVEIEHVIALKEAHDSGAWAWQPSRLVAFGNDLDDPRSLRAVTAAVNGAKGDADPSNWLPPDETYLCTYLGNWIAIKARWGLSMDQSEHGRIGNLLTERCPGHVIAPWPDAPPDAPPPIVPPPTSPPPVQPAIPAAPAGNCHPSYPTTCIPPAPPDLDCSDISSRRFVVLPPDPHGFDGNGDGVGCES